MKKENCLMYPLNFKITSTITHREPVVFLQHFIDHISIYSFLGGDCPPEVVRISLIVKQFIRNEALEPLEQDHEEFSELLLSYLKQMEFIKEDDALTDQKKVQYCKEIFQSWEEEQTGMLERRFTIVVEGDQTLNITFHLYILATLFGFKIERVLTYYMKQLCLPTSQATDQWAYKSARINRPYLLIGEINSTQKNIQLLYESKFFELFAAMDKVKSLKVRLENYKAFYEQWYLDLNAGFLSKVG